MAYDNVKNIVEEYNAAKSTFEEKMKSCFTEIFSEFFSNYPEIKAVGWNQYTPYFNDGDTCEFSVDEFCGVSENQSLSADFLEDISSAYELEEELEFSYKKPSNWMYDDPKYADEIKTYEEVSKKDPRYDIVCEGWKELKEVLRSIPKEIFLEAFGDHAFILATKDGLNIREYDHY